LGDFLVGCRHHRGRIRSARAARRAELARRINPLPQTTLPRLRCADRRSLLAGTALASTLLLSSLLAPTPAYALTNCLTGNPPPGRIAVTVADDIICINVDNRFNNVGTKVIDLTANGGNHYITLFNSGTLDAKTPPALPPAFTLSRMASTARSAS